ncbi:MAG: mechanosensitive ion channel [Acidobacteria bacterium]|nr:mechanosensitive ion channel [Acidobacteriota bacterium]
MSALNRVALSFVWLWQAQPQQLPAAPPTDAPAAEKVDWFARVWNDYVNRPFHVGDTLRVSFATLGFALVIILGALILSRSLRRFLEARFAAHKRLDAGLQYTILRLTHYLIVALGLLFALKVGFNADLTSLAVVFTALSVGIGFGLQYIAGDIASGFILLFERPVRVGDFITVGIDSKTIEGKVKSINLRTTLVMTNDRVAVIVPNSKLVSDNLVNWSNPDQRSRVSTGFGDYTLDFRLLVWTDRPRRHPKIKSDINFRINRLFKEAGIEIPSPQREVLLRGGRLSVDTRDGGGDAQHRFDYGVEDREEDFSRR